MTTRNRWVFGALMVGVLGVALCVFGVMFGGGAAFGAFWLMLFAFGAGRSWAEPSR
jgi:hypothetical protein